MARKTKTIETIIPNAGTNSAPVTMDQDRIPVALELPAGFTGTSLTFRSASSESAPALLLYFESTLYTVTVGPSRHVSLNRVAFEGVKFLTIVSNAAEAAARTINVIIGE